MNKNFNGWIDIPVIDAIEYFSGVLGSFFGWAVHYAQFIGLVGLCWSAFKLANSRFTVRDFWWDTLYKWLIFLLMMNLYVPVTAGISYIGNKIGIEAGKGKDSIGLALENMKISIQKDLETEMQWEEELSVELKSHFDNMELPSISNNTSYNNYIDSVYDAIGAAKFDSKQEKKEAKAIVDEYKNKKTGQSIYGARTLKALDDILIEREIDGSKGETLLDAYVDLNIWLHDKKGEQTNYLSPAALLRLATLSCQILWDQNQLVLTADLDDLKEEDIGYMKKGFSKFTATLAHIPSMIMVMICCIAIIVSIIFSDIQYLMCILEFTIVVGIGAFFIPFILFDGTKELPKKLVPVFTGFIIKMIVMNIIIFFIFNELIINTVQIMTDDAGMNWVTFAGQLFFCFIALILSANGPKIAMTILTGQPQLSMGEFVQMAGSVAAAAVGAGKATGKIVSGAAHVGKEGVRKTAQGVIDAHGNISKARSAAQSASSAVKDLGGTDAQARKAAAKGVFATATADLKDKVNNTANNFLHGDGKKGKGGGGGSSGAGSQAFQRSGQNTLRDLPEGDSRTLNNTSNPKFQNATRYDEATGQNVNMTRNEYYDEKRSQGANIGNDIALKMMEEAEKKQQAQNKSSQLPENLTDGVRASK